MTSLLAYPRISAAGFLASMLRRFLFCSNTSPSNPNHHQPKDSAFEFQSEIITLGCREEPTYIELEEDERFFILSFENKFRSRRGNTYELIGNQERSKIYWNGEEENCNPNEDPQSGEPETVEVRRKNQRERRRKKMKNRGNDDKKFKEVECKSENWSPVSVLDNDVFTTSSDLSTPEEEDEKFEDLRSPNSVMKLSKLEEYKLSALVDGNKKGTLENILWKQTEICDEIEKICNEEIDESRWIYRTTPKLQDIGEELEDDIMGDLLGELIVEMNVGMVSLL